MPGKVCALAGSGVPVAVVRFKSAPKLFKLLSVLVLKSIASSALTSCLAESRKSRAMDRMGAPMLAVVKAPQATVIAVPLIR